MEYTRLRVFNDPRDERTGGTYLEPAYQGPERTLDVRARSWDQGMGLGIDFHYADRWADPSKQAKPPAWRELPFDELTQEVYDYTGTIDPARRARAPLPRRSRWATRSSTGSCTAARREIIGTTAPQYFTDEADVYQSQPGGGCSGTTGESRDPAEQQPTRRVGPVRHPMASGIRAVREAPPESEVEIHAIVDTGRLDKTMEFWAQLLTRLEAADAGRPTSSALSYYPEWHGSPEELERTCTPSLRLPGVRARRRRDRLPPSCRPATRAAAQLPVPADRAGPGRRHPARLPGRQRRARQPGAGVLVWEPANWQPMFTWVETGSGWFPEPNASLDVFHDSDVTHVLEDTVHVVTTVDDDARLPRRVDVLTPADGGRRRRPRHLAGRAGRRERPSRVRSPSPAPPSPRAGHGDGPRPALTEPADHPR